MALRSSGLTYTPVFDFDPTELRKSLRNQTRNLLGQYTSAQGAVLIANRRSLEWVQKRAVEELDKSIAAHGRPQTYNSGNLRRAIEEDKFSSATKEGFQFLIDQRIEPAVPYYRAIESGSSHFVGRRIVLDFLDPLGGQHPRSTSNTDHGVNGKHKNLLTDPVLGVSNARRKDAIIGPRQRGTKGGPNSQGVIIRNPIPAYHYGSRAATAFRTAGIYKRYLRTALKEYGIKVDFS